MVTYGVRPQISYCGTGVVPTRFNPTNRLLLVDVHGHIPRAFGNVITRLNNHHSGNASWYMVVIPRVGV